MPWRARSLLGTSGKVEISVPRAEALSFSLLFHASQFVPVTLCGLAFLLVEHVTLSEAAHAAPAAPDP